MEVKKIGCLPKGAEIMGQLSFGALTFRGGKSFKDRGSSSFSGIKKIKGNSTGLKQKGNGLPVLERTFLLLLPL